MAQVPISPGPRIGMAPLPRQNFEATDVSAVGRSIGKGLQDLGQAGSDFAQEQERIGEIHDEAAVKEQVSTITDSFLKDAYTGENAFFRTKGRSALLARPGLEANIDDQISRAKSALLNDRQRAMFKDAIDPQRQRWGVQIATHADTETVNFGVDQAKSRSETAIDAGISAYPTDPVEGEKQLSTAYTEIESLGRLQGAPEEVVTQAKREAQTKLLTEVALNRAVADPVGAWAFIDQNQARLGGEAVTRLQTQLRPRVLKQQGIDLADYIGGADPPKGPDGATRDPLAPLPAGEKQNADTVWARMVGPDGKGGIEGGTNPDGSFRTSPKGALGPAQVMPGTAREAAAAAGLPYDEHRYKTDAVYNLALGRGYYDKQLAKFGDPVLAAAAYNAGPGRIEAALKKGGADGWMAHVPAETRKYVAAVGSGGSGGSTPRVALAEQLRTIESLDVPEEVKDSAREVLVRRAQTANLIAKDEHDQWLNSFELSLHDGTAGKGDIEAARKAGKLTDYDEVNRAEGIVAAREKDTRDLTNFGRMTSDPHFTFNQYDSDQRNAVEAGVKAMGGTPAAAFKVWQRTGILAKSGSIALRGALVSTDARAIREAANIAGNMLRKNPNAFAGVEGQSDIEHAAVAFNHYVFDLGENPQVAAARVAQENDPKFKEKTKYTDPQRQEAMKQLRQNGTQAQFLFGNAAFANLEQREEANQTYHELIVDQLSRGADLGTAQAQAVAQLRKVYAPNARGRIVKYAPEAVYPAIGGSYAYIYQDAERTVKAETGRTPVVVNLVPIPGVTDEDFRNGRTARYRLLYSYKSNGQTIVDAVPGEFAADTSGPVKELATQRRRSFAQERRQEVDRQKAERERDPTMRGTGAFH